MVKEIFGDWYKSTEDTFYIKLAEITEDNSSNVPQATRSRPSTIGVATGPPSTLDKSDGRGSGRIGVHITPTKKRRIMIGKLTNHLEQDWR